MYNTDKPWEDSDSAGTNPSYADWKIFNKITLKINSNQQKLCFVKVVYMFFVFAPIQSEKIF